jgi:hypothetical protein
MTISIVNMSFLLYLYLPDYLPEDLPIVRLMQPSHQNKQSSVFLMYLKAEYVPGSLLTGRSFYILESMAIFANKEV